jgi:signal transduction histidine kinase
MIGVEKELGMPLRITLPGGRMVYQSPTWPHSDDPEKHITATHVHPGADGISVFHVTVIRNLTDYWRQLERLRDTSMAVALVVTLTLVLVVVWFIKKTTLTPLQSLGRHLRSITADQSSLGKTIEISGNKDVQELANGYNVMTGRLKALYDELQRTNDELQAEVRERERAEVQLKINRDHLEELVEQRTADLAVARDAALRASQAKSRFLANMSHELRTPLNAIIGYSEMVLESEAMDSDEQAREDVDRIHTSGKHLLSLINDILDISKIEAGKMNLELADFDIEELIHSVTATTKPIIEQNRNELVVEYAEDVGVMHADGTKLRQALLNLLSNAAKFTEEGKIFLSVKRIEQMGQEYVVFTVKDTGIGLSGEEVQNIFQAFNQADTTTTRKYGGTGLGLTITSHYCQMMGGEITVTGTPGRGAEFNMYIPAQVKPLSPFEQDISLEDKTHDPEALRKTPGEARKGEERRRYVSKVLVIDEDAAVRDRLQKALNGNGYHVINAESAASGLGQVLSEKPDVIILDMLLKETDGWDVLSELKQNPLTQNIPVILMSIIEDQNMGFVLGALNYLPKPVDQRRLFSMVSRCVRRKNIAPILVLEEENPLREGIVRILDEEGWQAIEARTPAEAIDEIKRQIPSLIIHDLLTKGMDGYEFLSQLRGHEDWRHIPHITITALDLTPLDRQRLRQSVERVLLHTHQSCAHTIERVLDELDHCVGE